MLDNIYLDVTKRLITISLGLTASDPNGNLCDIITRRFEEDKNSYGTFMVYQTEAATKSFCRKARTILDDYSFRIDQQILGCFYYLFLSFKYVFDKIGFTQKHADVWRLQQQENPDLNAILRKAKELFGDSLGWTTTNDFAASTASYATIISITFDQILEDKNAEPETNIEVLKALLNETSLSTVLTVTEAKKPTSGTAGSGCYIATCVYGSYDCPEVWVLRRFRDNKLKKNWFGRAFIRFYYAISPTIVKWFGDKIAFHRFFKKRLDKMVRKYKLEGFEDTPYYDIK